MAELRYSDRTDASGDVPERSVGVSGFPYVVVCRAAEDEVEVLAVHHERRRPVYWPDRAEDV